MKKLFPFLLLASALLFAYCGSDDDGEGTPENVNISIADVTANEGDTYTQVTVTLSLDAATTEQITAFISTINSTAVSGEDFVGFTDAAVVFAAGETTKTYSINIIGDLLTEADESFDVIITSVTGPATITDGTATITLTNEDAMVERMVPVAPSIDWDALNNLPMGSDVPYDVFNFGQPISIPNSEYTTISAVGDTISFDARISQTGDTLLYFEFVADSIDLGDYFDDISEPVTQDDDVFLNPQIIVTTDEELDFKYDIIFYVGKASGERVGPYTIDPIIRVFPR